MTLEWEVCFNWDSAFNTNNQCERGGLRQRLWVYGVCAMLGEP